MSRKRFTASHQWVSYFRMNAASSEARSLPEAEPASLTPAIRYLLARSLPAWQLGETSEGNHLRKAACQYAERHDDPDFLQAVDFFIREEQRHGAALGDWLDRVGIPRRRRDLGDSLFRFCRHAIPNYAVWASVVVMVEAMAELYYREISRLSPCPRLREECRQILRDEVKHIQFQCEHLAYTRRKFSKGLLADLWIFELLFYTVVCAAVWFAHGQVFRAAGTSLGRFAEAAWRKFRRNQRLMRPDRYDFRDGKWPCASCERQVFLPR